MLASGPVLGLAFGWILGGDPRRLGDLRLGWWPLLALGVVLRVAAGGAADLAAVVYVVAFGLIVTVALANVSVPGMPLIAAGAAVNLLVVLLNGGMPVDPAAVSTAGARMPGDALHVQLTASTTLAPLADVIPLPPVGGVYSVGDVALTVGGFWLPFAWVRRR